MKSKMSNKNNRAKPVKCIKIGSDYCHAPRAAAAEWSIKTARHICLNYRKLDKRYSDTVKGRNAYSAWREEVEKKAFRRSLPIFKKFFEFDILGRNNSK